MKHLESAPLANPGRINQWRRFRRLISVNPCPVNPSGAIQCQLWPAACQLVLPQAQHGPGRTPRKSWQQLAGLFHHESWRTVKVPDIPNHYSESVMAIMIRQQTSEAGFSWTWMCWFRIELLGLNADSVRHKEQTASRLPLTIQLLDPSGVAPGTWAWHTRSPSPGRGRVRDLGNTTMNSQFLHCNLFSTLKQG